jgi:hypothetical protein
MQKSKALTLIRRRHRGSGLIIHAKSPEHPLVIIMKAANLFIEGLICVLKTVAEAEDPIAMAERFEKSGVTKLHLDTAEKLSTAIKICGDRIYPQNVN